MPAVLLIAAACDTGSAVDCNPTTATDLVGVACIVVVVLAALVASQAALGARHAGPPLAFSLGRRAIDPVLVRRDGAEMPRFEVEVNGSWAEAGRSDGVPFPRTLLILAPSADAACAAAAQLLIAWARRAGIDGEPPLRCRPLT
jgi:hypothetical protein